ncbi:hypothetical protein MMC16_006115 [Acarospora aff. strigata]|nr:hypothetical protein [Acarospora aff. strigata]
MNSSSGHLNFDSNNPTSSSQQLREASPRGTWDPSTNHDTSTNGHDPNQPPNQPSLHPDNLPNGRKPLAGISLRAFILGTALGASSLLCILLLLTHNPLWRAPFFIATLSLFHFLEYWTTAAYNTRYATISAFLLSQNGSAYNIAHTAALFECITTNLFFAARSPPSSSSSWPKRVLPEPEAYAPSVLVVGFVMIAVGQCTRTLAMAQAGSNFNHTVQMKKKDGHELVTRGIYAYLRHPSYFGFFWWGLGTQVVLGNAICFVAYAAVLWSFFSSRITREEELLIKFFGTEYVEYRQRTWVGIPFIR